MRHLVCSVKTFFSQKKYFRMRDPMVKILNQKIFCSLSENVLLLFVKQKQMKNLLLLGLFLLSLL